MGFSDNPLSLSIPDSAFETWLQDSGYVDLLDHRTSAVSPSSPTAKPDTAIDGVGCFSSLLTQLVVVFSLLTINPFSKLAADDFAGDTPPWTIVCFGDCYSSSFPSSSQEARMRVHENVKRFAKNYATLFFVFFTCALETWKFRCHPVIWQISIRVAQYATARLLMFLNVQIAIFYALAISYTVVILHGGFRNSLLSKK